jgi:hypothetical protein
MNSNFQKTNPIKTILTINVGFLLVYLFTGLDWFLYISVVIGLCGLFSSYLASKIDFLWMKLAWILSLILPNVIMTLVFYFFLTPIALLSKLFGNNNPLDLKNMSNSLFKDSNKSFKKESFEKIW